jgi:diguanylate cyclase (GGDEF)-like protein
MRRALSGHSSVYGRWGGEEFVVVIYGAAEEELRILADHLRSSVENEKFEGVGAVTCSIGAAVLEENDTFETWFDRADNAVYTAKSNGRNCIHIA